jgi:ppGpp synthetase/RelA/SpoT-type nucleotidyltranferase
MRSPTSFALAFLAHRALGEELERIAGRRLQLLCKERDWLFTDRVKSEESALAKLELSPVSSLSAMHDLYAATIVVPTAGDVETAVNAVRTDLPDAAVVPRRRTKADTFRYDDTHLTASLGDHAAGLASAIGERTFEIQIKTGLQFAWWRATHDVLYKGAEQNWQVSRVAGQIRASLELLDAQLTDLRGAARLQKSDSEDDIDKGFADAASLLGRWDGDRRPANVSSFVRSVQDLMRSAGVTHAELEEALDGAETMAANTEVTPVQCVLAALAQRQGLRVVTKLRGDLFVLVTDELEAAAPLLRDVRPERRATLV